MESTTWPTENTTLLYSSFSSEKEEIKLLQEEIQDLKNDLKTSAEAGIGLLKVNQELEDKYEKDVQYYQQQIEELKQNNYTLTNKLRIQTITHQAFNEELELVKSQTESEFVRRIDLLEQDHALKVRKLLWQLEETQGHVDRLIKSEESLKEKISQQEALIAELSENTFKRETDDIHVDELSDLQRKVTDYSCQTQELQLLLSDKTRALNEQQDNMESLEMRLKELEQALEERVKLSNELYHELKDSQDNNKLLQSQLEQNKLKQLEEDWQNSGNSLFGEVEERRLETERKLISLQVKYDTLERSHQMLKQHFKKLKAEMSALLCRAGTLTADSAQVERLQRSLQQRNSEMRSLLDKIYRLEEEKKNMIPKVGGDKSVAAGELGHVYLKQQIASNEKSLAQVKKDLQLSTTQLLWETAKLTEAESKLHKSEQDKARLVNDATKMKLKLNQAQEKENELKVQLKMADAEIEALKQQLKTKLRKGHQPLDSSLSVKSPTLPSLAKQEEEIKVVKKEVVRPVNLLEELEKENTKPLLTTTNHHPVIVQSSNTTTINKSLNEEDSGVDTTCSKDTITVTQTAPSSQNKEKLSATTEKVVKINTENVNKCPQQ